MPMIDLTYVRGSLHDQSAWVVSGYGHLVRVRDLIGHPGACSDR
jgi:hypothetical protein